MRRELDTSCEKSPHGNHEFEVVVLQDNSKISYANDIAAFCKFCLHKEKVK